MIKDTKISTGQLFSLFFISKIFFLMMYSPKTGEQIDNSVFLFGQILAIPITFLALTPFYLIYKQEHSKDIVSISMMVNKKLAVAIGILYSLVCIFMATNTLSNFEYFLTVAIYPNNTGGIFILTMIIGVAYTLYIGLEPVARLGGFVIAIVIVATAIISLSLIKDVNMVFFHGFFGMNLKDIIKTTYYSTVYNNDLILLLLVSDLIRGNIKKALPKYILISSTFYIGTIFLIITVLGDYSKVLIFPLHSLSAVAQLSFIQRLDSIYMMIWVFVAFVKISFLLLMSGYTLSKIINVNKKYLYGVSALIALVLAVAINSSFSIFQKVGLFINTGVLYVVFVVALPLIIYILFKIKTRRIKA